MNKNQNTSIQCSRQNRAPVWLAPSSPAARSPVMDLAPVGSSLHPVCVSCVGCSGGGDLKQRRRHYRWLSRSSSQRRWSDPPMLMRRWPTRIKEIPHPKRVAIGSIEREPRDREEEDDGRRWFSQPSECGGINPYTLTARLGPGGLAHYETSSRLGPTVRSSAQGNKTWKSSRILVG